MTNFKSNCRAHFKMGDMGPIYHCLEMTTERNRRTLEANLKQYIQTIINKYGLTDANTVSTPADANVTSCKHYGVSQ